MIFYNVKEYLYLEKDVSGVGLGAALLQGMEMWFLKDETHADSALWPLTFRNKSLTSVKTCCIMLYYFLTILI